MELMVLPTISESCKRFGRNSERPSLHHGNQRFSGNSLGRVSYSFLWSQSSEASRPSLRTWGYGFLRREGGSGKIVQIEPDSLSPHRRPTSGFPFTLNRWALALGIAHWMIKEISTTNYLLINTPLFRGLERP